MAVDTQQKRMSATNHSSPWRGPLVMASESGFGKGNRQAALYLYSGIEAATPTVASHTEPGLQFYEQDTRLHFWDSDERLHFWDDDERLHYWN